MDCCARHPGVETERACASCGRPFCPACLVELLGQPMCPECGGMQRLQPEPPVWRWQVLFCLSMAVLYLACVPVGIALWQLAPLVSPSRVEELRLQGGVLAACGFVMIFPYGVAPFLPKRPWAWTTHLVLICLTMTSGACVPLAAPLLIFWLKPETRRFFGRE